MFYYEILEKLFKHKIKYLVVGGLSVNLYGVPRMTQDIDIIISMEKENIVNLVKMLRDLGYEPRLPVDPSDLADTAKVNEWIDNRNLKAFGFYHPDAQYKSVDIVLVHPLDFDTAYSRKTVKKVRDTDIYLVSIDDLIEMKRSSGRKQDLSDIESLEKVKEHLRDK